MGTTYTVPTWNANESVRHFCRVENGVLPTNAQVAANPIFAQWAKSCWPIKTAAHIASIANRDVRTAERWLSGEYEPPIIVITAMLEKTFARA